MNHEASFTQMPITRFLIEEQRRINSAPEASRAGSFIALINDVRVAVGRLQVKRLAGRCIPARRNTHLARCAHGTSIPLSLGAVA